MARKAEAALMVSEGPEAGPLVEDQAGNLGSCFLPRPL